MLKLSATHLTQLLLMTLLTRPGDGRTANFIVADGGRLVSIDNGVSFVEPLIRGSFERKVNFCSILYCLQAQPLDFSVLEEWTRLAGDLIFAEWIEELIQKEKQYTALFFEQ